MLRATLPAPPIATSLRLTASTGAGASGEMRADLAIDEVVEHQIADAEDGLLADALETLFEIQHASDTGLRDRETG